MFQQHMSGETAGMQHNATAFSPSYFLRHMLEKPRHSMADGPKPPLILSI